MAGIARQMRVDVDEAGQTGGTGQIDDDCPARRERRTRWSHGGDRAIGIEHRTAEEEEEEY